MKLKYWIPIVIAFGIFISTVHYFLVNFGQANFLTNIEDKYWRVISIKVHKGYTISADSSNFLYCPYFTIVKEKGTFQYLTSDFCNQTRGKLEIDKGRLSLTNRLTTRVKCGKPFLDILNRERDFLQAHLTDSISEPSLHYFISLHWNDFNRTIFCFRQIGNELLFWNDSADTAKLIQVEKDKNSTYIRINNGLFDSIH